MRGYAFPQMNEEPGRPRALTHLPEDLLDVRHTCPNCSTSFAPPWLERMSSPMVPIKPDNYEGPGRWVRLTLSIRCPSCGGQSEFGVPYVKMKTRCIFHGDEAERQLSEDRILFSYSTVGADPKLIPEINQAVWALKREFSPKLEPKSWRIHTKDLLNGRWRRKQDRFKEWDESITRSFFERLEKLLCSMTDVFVFNIVNSASIKPGIEFATVRENTKEEAFRWLLLFMIDNLTRQGCQPHFLFDDDRKSDGRRGERNWASDLLVDSQKCLLYNYLSRGIEIVPPHFVPPGSEPCLELADFVSYVVARYHYTRWLKLQLDYDPARLGAITYLGFGASGDLRFHRTKSYPWELFYGNDPAS